MLKHLRRCVLMTLFLGAVCSTAAVAQIRGRSPGPDEFRSAGMQPAFFESLSFLSDSAGLRRVDVLYRIPYRFFVFIASDGDPDTFIGGGEVNIEVVDQDGDAVTRKLVRLSLEKPASQPAIEGGEPSPDGPVGGAPVDRMGPPGLNGSPISPAVLPGDRFVEGAFSFYVPPGPYRLITEIQDRESSRRYFDDERRITVPGREQSGFFSDLLFVKSRAPGDSSGGILPLNFGGDVPFGTSFEAYLEIATPGVPAESIRVSYTVNRPAGEQARWHTSPADIDINSVLSPQLETPMKGGSLSYRLIPRERGDIAAVWLRIPSDTLAEGRYSLTITAAAGARVDSISKEFSIRWFGKPRSLGMPLVIDQVMSYIMSDTQYTRFHRADDDESHRIFDAFWKKRDPTPKTIFNEALAEYFRRVDHTFQAFSTLNEVNGYRTDRGKTYIVYGEPDRMDRTFTPSAAPQEVWTYSGIRKKFTFIDERRKGYYTLLSIDPL